MQMRYRLRRRRAPNSSSVFARQVRFFLKSRFIQNVSACSVLTLCLSTGSRIDFYAAWLFAIHLDMSRMLRSHKSKIRVNSLFVRPWWTRSICHRCSKLNMRFSSTVVIVRI